MQLRDLTMEPLEIPFRVSFSHSARERSATESVLVRASTLDGATGLGEGCPRDYVTGESIASAVDFFNRHRKEWMEISGINDLRSWLGDNSANIDKNPAAYCAVELALLHAMRASDEMSLEEMVSVPRLKGKFRYTAVLGTRDPKQFKTLMQRYSEMGFSDYKLKIFGEPDVDSENARVLGFYTGEASRIRLDANNHWRDPLEAAEYIRTLGIPCFAVEEPVLAGDIPGCRDIARRIGVRIILDESFLTRSDFEGIEDDPGHWIINIRLSKMGGILRSLDIGAQARRLGIPLVIGAQVGETSLLTRAALTVANANRDNLLAQEGAFGTLVLERDIMEPPIMFGRGGILDAASLVI